MTRIAAISQELQTLMIGYKLWAVRGRQRDYRAVICSAGQTETLLFIRENTANPHVLFYISPRNTSLSWEFIYSLSEIPDADGHRLEFDRAWRGWEQEEGLPEQRQSNIQSHHTGAATLRAPSTSPTPTARIALSPPRLRTTPSIEPTPSITSTPRIHQLEEPHTLISSRDPKFPPKIQNGCSAPNKQARFQKSMMSDVEVPGHQWSSPIHKIV
jgi:hypothetical protein